MEGLFMKKINIWKNLFAIIMALFISSSVFCASVSAQHDGVIVNEYENAVSSEQFYLFGLNKSKYDEELSTIPKSFTVGEVGDKYYAYYPDALTYSDKTTKSIMIEIEYLGRNRYKDAGDEGASRYGAGIKLESDKDVRLNAMGMDYQITYYFYDDPEFTTPAKIYGAIGFADPDEGNYFYTGANTKKLYYVDAKGKKAEYKDEKLSDYFKVTSDGIFHINEEDTGWSTWIDFDDGVFAVPLKDESSFTFKSEGKHDFLFLLADIIQTHAPYKVAYYYETPEGYPENPDYLTDEIIVDIYDNKTVSITDDDKIPNPEKGDGYELNTDKDEKWELEVQPDGSTVLKVYFDLPYTIKYNPNASDAEGEMEDTKYTASDPTMDSDDMDGQYTREGYDFIGYKVENKGELKTSPEDFKDVLLEEEDREIELYAQWDPWKYTIKYDPNGGTGEMPDHVYKYNDPNMNSDPNKYTRKGYTFEGFVYTDKEGKQTLYKNINDFKDILLELGKNSEILLVAQWKKKPQEKEIHYYLPVTGVE